MLETVIVILVLVILGISAWACSVLRKAPEIIKVKKTTRCWICGDRCIDLDKDS